MSRRLEIAARIETVIDFFPSRKAASQVAGVTTEQLRSYMVGKAKPPFEVMARLCREAGISLDWLAWGDGPMKLGSAPRPTIVDAAVLDTIMEELRPIVAEFLGRRS